MREMALVAGDEVVGAGAIGGFKEAVVVGIGAYFETKGWVYEMAAIADELQQLQASTLADIELTAGEYSAILSEDGG
jgi:hypothetical protein